MNLTASQNCNILTVSGLLKSGRIVWKPVYLYFLMLRVAVINQLTNYMEQNPSWKVKNFLATHWISRILCKPKLHFRVYSGTLFVPIRSHTIQFTPSSYFFTTHINIIFPSTSRSSKLPLSFKFSYQNPLCIGLCLLPCMWLMPRQSHPPLNTLLIFVEKNKS